MIAWLLVAYMSVICEDVVDQCHFFTNECSQRRVRDVCAKTCDACGQESADMCLTTRKDEWVCDPQYRIYQEFEPDHVTKNAECSAAARALHSLGCPSDDSSFDNLIDHGYVIIRNVFKFDILNELVQRNLDIPLPMRYLCGASDVQPDVCKLDHSDMRRHHPIALSILEDIMHAIRQSGVADGAGMGFPLHISGGEYININKWPFARSTECIMHELVRASGAQCGSNASCAIAAVMERVSSAEMQRILTESLYNKSCEASPIDLGNFEYIMGGDLFNFTRWGHRRSYSNLKAHVTLKSKLPFYQGWHAWHVDGPSSRGRYHKIFVMLDKEGDRAATNIRLMPAHWHHAFAGCMDAIGGPTGHDRSHGVHPFERAFDALGCDVILDPGDVVVFREDVWHRTQDMTADRSAIIFDVLRWPLYGLPGIPRRNPWKLNQFDAINILHQHNTDFIDIASTVQPSCEDPSRDESLLTEGVQLVRNIISPREARTVYETLVALPVIKTENGGARIYHEQFDGAKFANMAPIANEALLSFIHNLFIDHTITHLWTSATAPLIRGVQLVRVDPAAHKIVDVGDWHIHEITNVGNVNARLHKIWLLLNTSANNATLIEYVTDTSIKRIIEHHMRRRTVHPYAQPVETPYLHEFHHEILSPFACAPSDMKPGDGIVMDRYTWHRTQDFSNTRSALLISFVV